MEPVDPTQASLSHPAIYSLIQLHRLDWDEKHTSGSNIDLLKERHLAHKVFGLRVGLSPLTLAIHPW